ncbi:hypothetical protein X772_23810 [Mesorhizobium sp. LSJC280B00]|nr:hypothetical protein X772_23810 [Mesorhizobium sp. LSJC280B00]
MTFYRCFSQSRFHSFWTTPRILATVGDFYCSSQRICWKTACRSSPARWRRMLPTQSFHAVSGSGERLGVKWSRVWG